MNKVCLVTGASGFIGKALCQALQNRRIKVKALLRRPLMGPWDEAIIQDLKEIHELSSQVNMLQGVDTVYHLAGIAHTTLSSPELYWKINLEATQILLNLVAKSQVRYFIYLSSVKANDPKDTYGYSKKAAEEVILKLGLKLGIHVCILRPALVYGPGFKGNLLSMLRGIEKGWFPPPAFIQNKRSLISLTDVVDCIIRVTEDPKANGKIYTITDGQIYSTRQLYDAMRIALGLPAIRWAFPLLIWKILAKVGDMTRKLMFRDFPFTSDTLEKLLGSADYSSQLIQEELDWVPQQNFFTVLPMIVKAYKSH